MVHSLLEEQLEVVHTLQEGQPGDNAGLEHHNLVMELEQVVGEEHREQELVQEEGGGALVQVAHNY